MMFERGTPRYRKACERSLREALSDGQAYIDTGHLLRGLLRDGDNLAYRALVALGVDPDELTKVVRGLQDKEHPHCPRCGRKAKGHDMCLGPPASPHPATKIA